MTSQNIFLKKKIKILLLFILVHLPEKPIKPSKYTYCLPLSMVKPLDISFVVIFFFTLSTSSTDTSQRWGNFNISPLSYPKSFKVEEIEALLKGQSVHSAVMWSFVIHQSYPS